MNNKIRFELFVKIIAKTLDTQEEINKSNNFIPNKSSKIE